MIVVTALREQIADLRGGHRLRGLAEQVAEGRTRSVDRG